MTGYIQLYSGVQVNEQELSEFATDLIGSAGVLKQSGSFGLNAAELSPLAGLKVNITTAGAAYVNNNAFAAYGDFPKFWLTRFSGSLPHQLTFAANSSGSTRIDLICIKVDTTVVTANADNTGVVSLVVVQGTPGAGAPAVPADHLKLYEVTIANGATNIVNANIADFRIEPTLAVTPVPANNVGFSQFDASAVIRQILNLNASNILDIGNVNIAGVNLKGWDGWSSADEAWTYDSVDEPIGVIRAAGDRTGRYYPGTKLKFQQDIALSAYWTFDTNSNSNVGSFNGTDTAMSYTSGKFSNGATFNGTTSKIAFTDNAVFKPATTFAIGCWLKTSASSGVFFNSFKQNGANFFGLYFAMNNTGRIAIQLGVGSASTAQVSGNKVINDGNFHYVVITLRDNILQVYVDGNLEGSGYVANPSYDASNTVRIGCENYTGSDSSFWNGQIDDFFIINGNTLDEDTIRAKYLAATAQGTGNITVTKKGIVMLVGAYTGVYTPLTVHLGTDFILQNATISNPYYSKVRAPQGFPLEEHKWQHTTGSTSDDVQSSPTAGTWYNPGSRSISVPIGAWKPNITGHFRNYIASGTDTNVYVSFSRANNLETNPEFTASGESTGATGDQRARVMMLPLRTLKVTVKTTWYLIAKTVKAGTNSIDYRGSFVPTIIQLINAYL